MLALRNGLRPIVSTMKLSARNPTAIQRFRDGDTREMQEFESGLDCADDSEFDETTGANETAAKHPAGSAIHRGTPSSASRRT